jgi:uncharacterized sulfatase
VHIITDKSLEFMESNQNQPFFLYVTHNTIHTPLMEKQSLIRKYRNKPGAELPENDPTIGAMMETLDNSVGRILARLDELELTDNTMVIFFSDNGGLERTADQHPLRSGKASLYEGGIRVPFIVRWPGQVPAGAESDQIISSVDFFPTLLDIAGSNQNYSNIDGVSLLPVLTESRSLAREAIYWHYPHYHSAGEGPCGAIRQGSYKLIEWYVPTLWDLEGQIELYNLAEDIGERNDLADDLPEKAAELRQKLHAWRKSVNAQMPVKNPDYTES